MSNFVLGVHSNLTSGDFTGGHAWITITNKTNLATVSYGLWPDGHPRTLDNKDGSDVRIGMEPPKGLANRYYALSQEQYIKLQRLIMTTEYWFYTNNCSSWSSQMVYKLLRVDIDADDYFGIETPREFGHNIIELELISPSTILTPITIKPNRKVRGLH
ncbi:hypothetical protein [Sulfurimonas sp.]|uniref:hypothetical protein n=1 Tax=Sulfurimonas sp. TaxID=2022749 RepID=UPI002B47AD8D|nr:hypothetical protein [Sulfurimonas sp.]